MKRFYRQFWMSSVGLGALIVMAPGAVQTAAAAEGPGAAEEGSTLETVIVTARRVGENLQTTPVAVTALSQESLDAKQIAQFTDLVRTTPSLSANGAGTGGALVAALSIRGQAQVNGGQSNDLPVGIYIDGVYYARPLANNGALVDMESVEVLRGPQGTLFGRNTTGGALNLTTRAPTDSYEGYLKGGVGNYELREAEAMLNLPLGEEFGFRFAGSYTQRDGYVRNVNTNEREANIEGHYFGRASLKWSPESLPMTWRLTGDYTKYKDDGTPAVLRSAPPAATPGLGILASFLSTPDSFYNTYTGVTAAGSYVNATFGFPPGFGANGAPQIDRPHNKLSHYGYTSNLEADLGETKLKSITGWRYSDATNTYDLDGSPLNLIAFESEYIAKQFSQEFQLSGSFGKVDWITGLIYFKESGSERSDAWQFSTFSRDLTDYKSSSKGAFLQLNYHLSDRLRATGGFRYTWDKRSAVRHGTVGGTPAADFTNAACAVVTPPPATLAGCNDPRSGKFDYPAWLLSVDYQVTPDYFVYLKTSGASMAGGVNFRAVPAGNEQFEPEHVRDIEAGLKADLFDRRLRTNLAAFYIWREGLQANVSTVTGGRSTQYQINGGDVRHYGFEFEGAARPWEGMELTGALSYLHSEFVGGSFRAPNAAGTGTIDRSSEGVPQAPKWNWNIGATQRFDLSIGTLTAHVDYVHVGGFAFGQASVDPSRVAANNGFLLTQAGVDRLNQLGTVPSRNLLNGRLALKLEQANVEFALWGRNLTREKYLTSVFTGLYGATGLVAANVGAPRTYGASISVGW